jgi:hypothetical protein
MAEYQIQDNTRRCTVSGRELKPGEKYFSVLFDEGGAWVRRDFSPECWAGAPQGAYSFWSGRLPQGGESRRLPVDDELLLDCLRRMDGEVEPARINFRFVVALLLMRRKKLKLVEARQEGVQELLMLQVAQSRETLAVVNPQLTDEEMNAVQDEVFEVLGW